MRYDARRAARAKAKAAGADGPTASGAGPDLRLASVLDTETVGLLGRSYKDLWEREPDGRRKVRLLRLSYSIYEGSYRARNEYWTGINAATLAYCLGERARAADIARAVRDQCLAAAAAADAAGKGDYWAVATLGEAALVLGDWDEARR